MKELIDDLAVDVAEATLKIHDLHQDHRDGGDWLKRLIDDVLEHEDKPHTEMFTIEDWSDTYIVWYFWPEIVDGQDIDYFGDAKTKKKGIYQELNDGPNYIQEVGQTW